VAYKARVFLYCDSKPILKKKRSKKLKKLKSEFEVNNKGLGHRYKLQLGNTFLSSAHGGLNLQKQK